MTRRRALVISVLMGLGIGILVLAAILPSEDSGDVAVDTNPAVSELLPPRGETVLPQANVGAILAAGWAGEILHIDGTAIPLDQQRVEPALNSVVFRPDEGLVLERLPSQKVCATVRYWSVRNPDRTSIIDWCFRVDG
ncbi:MAG: hypothetical protein CL466_02250 [Acidimicrobiaceae bacterium]|nr:hypothetical protein [Acidimicrobiaceae bacterium]